MGKKSDRHRLRTGRTAMDSEEYIQGRLDHQIDWYAKRSQSAQARFKWIRGCEIVVAAAIPVLVATGDWDWAGPVVAVLGAVLLICSGFQSLGQYQGTWIKYKTSSELLIREKLLFLTHAPPCDSNGPFKLLVDRIEGLLASEHVTWGPETRSPATRSAPKPLRAVPSLRTHASGYSRSVAREGVGACKTLALRSSRPAAMGHRSGLPLSPVRFFTLVAGVAV